MGIHKNAGKKNFDKVMGNLGKINKLIQKRDLSNHVKDLMCAAKSACHRLRRVATAEIAAQYYAEHADHGDPDDATSTVGHVGTDIEDLEALMNAPSEAPEGIDDDDESMLPLVDPPSPSDTLIMGDDGTFVMRFKGLNDLNLLPGAPYVDVQVVRPQHEKTSDSEASTSPGTSSISSLERTLFGSP